MFNKTRAEGRSKNPGGRGNFVKEKVLLLLLQKYGRVGGKLLRPSSTDGPSEWKPNLILNFFGIIFRIISGDFKVVLSAAFILIPFELGGPCFLESFPVIIKGGLSAAFIWIRFELRESEWKPAQFYILLESFLESLPVNL